jgi:3-phosphoshikimate 1-carboxyvinyltransferase
MEITLSPAKVKGIVQASASKSVMQRACAAALLRNGTTTIWNYGISDDDKAALAIIEQLGASVHIVDEHRLEIKSDGWPQAKAGTVIDCGESGLSLRMFTPIIALMEQAVVIKGHGSLLKRPMAFFKEILSGLQVSVHSDAGTLPMEVRGPLHPVNCIVDGSITSQMLTGLLFAYSVALKEDIAIEVRHLKSKPYIDLTLKVMEDFGMNLPANANYERFDFKYKPARQTPEKPLQYTIEADWSNAAFFMVAGAIAGGVTIKGLDVFTVQADKKILEALQDCGCRLSIQMNQIEVQQHQLKAFHFDATDCPDLFPPLVALAAHCMGTSVIEGVHRLGHKESNRAISLQQEFATLGVRIQIQDDKMIIQKEQTINKPVNINGHNDHRIVMATAIAALNANHEVTIHGAEAVNKSFPDFFKTLTQIKTG